jgi:putative flippase GtrA
MNLQIRGEALRFIVIGAINTVATYALYLVLLPQAGYKLAYTAAYVVGIVFAYLLNTRFVFRVRRTLASFTLFPLVYLVQYALGIATLYVAVTLFNVPERFALIASIVVTIPITFLLSRLVLKRSTTGPASGYPL